MASLTIALSRAGTRYRLRRVDRLLETGRGREARRVMARLRAEMGALL